MIFMLLHEFVQYSQGSDAQFPQADSATDQSGTQTKLEGVNCPPYGVINFCHQVPRVEYCGVEVPGNGAGHVHHPYMYHFLYPCSEQEG